MLYIDTTIFIILFFYTQMTWITTTTTTTITTAKHVSLPFVLSELRPCSNRQTDCLACNHSLHPTMRCVTLSHSRFYGVLCLFTFAQSLFILTFLSKTGQTTATILSNPACHAPPCFCERFCCLLVVCAQTEGFTEQVKPSRMLLSCFRTSLRKEAIPKSSGSPAQACLTVSHFRSARCCLMFRWHKHFRFAISLQSHHWGFTNTGFHQRRDMASLTKPSGVIWFQSFSACQCWNKVPFFDLFDILGVILMELQSSFIWLADNRLGYLELPRPHS